MIIALLVGWAGFASDFPKKEEPPTTYLCFRKALNGWFDHIRGRRLLIWCTQMFSSSLILLLCLMSACFGSECDLPALSLLSSLRPASSRPSSTCFFISCWPCLSAQRLSWLLLVSWGRVLSVSSLPLFQMKRPSGKKGRGVQSNEIKAFLFS